MSGPRQRRALYVCYLSLEDPLVHTQVIAYLRGLAEAGHRIHLLTFEARRLTRATRRGRSRALAADGITWHGLRYHKRPSLPATAYDTMLGALYAAFLVQRHSLDTLHARSHVPAAMSLIVKRVLWRRDLSLIFDIRGLMAEEYEDAGRWRRGSAAFRLTKFVERRAIRQAAAIIVLTERISHQLFGPSPPANVTVIPCCADIDSLTAAGHGRASTRQLLALEDGATVMIYVGKFGGWYMAQEMAAFFAVAREAIPSLHFLILTQGSTEEIDREFERRRVRSGYTITSTSPDRLGSYLSAADFGISFIRPSPSKASSSPTKIGEYLAAGLPVLSTSGIGDLDQLITPDVGVLLSEHTHASYQAAAARIDDLRAQPDTPTRCRAVAESKLALDSVGVPRYCEVYAALAANSFGEPDSRHRRSTNRHRRGPAPDA